MINGNKYKNEDCKIIYKAIPPSSPDHVIINITLQWTLFCGSYICQQLNQ